MDRSGNLQRVDAIPFKGIPERFRTPFDKTVIKEHIVPDQDILSAKLQEIRNHLLPASCVFHHVIGDAGNAGDIGRNRQSGLYKFHKALLYLSVTHL